MTHTYFIFGYGVPKDITTDSNYSRYLSEVVANIEQDNTTVVCVGGPTDLHPPYNRTEAEVMQAYLQAKSLLSKKLDQGISTIENLLAVKEYLTQHQQKEATIFCEWTRKERIAELAQKILNIKINVVGIDFDQSPRRSQAADSLQEKEQALLKLENAAINSQDNRQTFHQLYEKKLTMLREAGIEQFETVMNTWWQLVIDEASNL